MQKTKISINDIKSKSKEDLAKIVWSLYVDYIDPHQETDKAQTNTFALRFNKIQKNDVHFTDIDDQKCRLVNGKLYI